MVWSSLDLTYPQNKKAQQNQPRYCARVYKKAGSCWCGRRNRTWIILICILLLFILLSRLEHISFIHCTCESSSCENRLLISDVLPDIKPSNDDPFWQGKSARYFFSPKARAAIPADQPNVLAGSNMSCLGDVDRFLDTVKELSTTKELILLYVDSGYVDMAINLYLTSLKALGITNYMYLCSDQEGCQQLEDAGVTYFRMCVGALEDGASGYGTVAFRMKMKFRGKVLLGLLRAGYTVLNCDTDIVFLQDPLVYIRNIPDVDLVGMDNIKNGINAGFMYVRPTPASLRVYQMMEEIALREPTMEEQNRLNIAIATLTDEGNVIRVIKLPVELFPSGMTYFMDGNRTFAGDNPDSEVFVIHNNWIVSREAKVYRFREHLLWLHETDGYYSDPKRRYLVYDNPIVHGGLIEILQLEKMALKTALALSLLLNRTLILPEFHIDDPDFRRGSLSFLYSMAGFDQSFKDKYREHVFLRHPLVPTVLKKSNSKRNIIMTPPIKNKFNLDSTVTVKTPKNVLLGATESEIMEWFGSKTESILRFHSLYGGFAGFDYIVRQHEFEELFLNATVACDMLQRCDESLLPPAVRKKTKRRLSMRPPKPPKPKANPKAKAAKKN